MGKSNLQLKEVAQVQARAKVAYAPTMQSPLHGFGLAAKARSQDDRCGVWMNELPLLGYIVVRGDAQDPAFRRATHDALGIELPSRPGSFVPFNQGVAIWQTPDEWLLAVTRPSCSAYVAELENALKDVHAQVVDNSGGLTMVYLSGARQVELLRHVSPYDFDSLGAGSAVSTVCAKAAITVLRYDTHGLFVIFRRSFADYVWRLLEKAARPYGLGISSLAYRASHPVLALL